MSMTSIGDLAQHFTMSRHNADLNTRLSTLVQEMATGRKTDVSNPVTGDYLILGDIERSLQLLEGYKQTTAEATLFTDATQAALETIDSSIQGLAGDLVSLASSATDQLASTLSSQAKEVFGTLVGTLNSSVAGRSLFSGTATDQAALASAEDILAELEIATATATTPLEFRTAIETWFSGTGFTGDGYLGNDDALTFQLGEGDRVENGLNANSQPLRDTLTEVAIAALAVDFPAGFSTSENRALLLSSGEALMAGQSALTGQRADLGLVQERVENASAQNANRQSALELARVDIVAADPYETATKLETARLQLETLYAVTARLSGLNLTSFLR